MDLKPKPHKNQKPRRRRYDDDPVSLLPLGMQQTREMESKDVKWKEPTKTFTPMQTGQPDQDESPDIHNPQGVQGGRGPLNQEGEGNRQNDELAELEQVEPDIEKS